MMPSKKIKTTHPKTVNADALTALMDASAVALGLTIKPEWAAGVRGNLEVTLRLARTFEDFPLPDDAEPAPVFEA